MVRMLIFLWCGTTGLQNVLTPISGTGPSNFQARKIVLVGQSLIATGHAWWVHGLLAGTK